MSGEPHGLTPAWRMFWLAFLTVHGFLAGVWWWLMPGGFPLTHPRFGVNRLFPGIILFAALWGLLAAGRRRYASLRTSIVGFPVGWIAAAISARVVFPVSFATIWLAPLIAGAAMLLLYYLAFRQMPRVVVRRESGRLESTPAGTAVVMALCIGLATPALQRARKPDTHPLNVAIPAALSGKLPAPLVTLSRRLRIQSQTGTVTFKSGELAVTVEPILRFISRSPDRCWTLLAPTAGRDGQDRILTGAGLGRDGLTAAYRDDGESVLRVRSARDAAEIESYTRLSRPIFSHLNSFCDMSVAGHKHLTISFSPCGDRQFDVKPFDFPFGSPERIAYLDGTGGFRVVEASNADKGPFRELAAGRLARSAPLVITFYDEGAPMCQVTLDDWAAQAGTQLSPTAGWGLPVNAIEFSLNAHSPDSSAGIWITLAGTSPGVGWDSVGHSAGVYRNRMRIEALAEPLR